jgi:ribosomal protein L24E
MPKCSYCGKSYEPPKGVTLVDSKTGTIHYYCSSKCRKNAKKGRKKRKWAKQSSENKEK